MLKRKFYGENGGGRNSDGGAWKKTAVGRDDRDDFRDFICKVCGAKVSAEGAGGRHRNHCPYCLTSLHLDDEPGDRASDCGGAMDAIGVWARRDGEWSVVHRCRRCGTLHSNRIAADDDPLLLMSLAVRPLAMPPFPLSALRTACGDGKESAGESVPISGASVRKD